MSGIFFGMVVVLGSAVGSVGGVAVCRAFAFWAMPKEKKQSIERKGNVHDCFLNFNSLIFVFLLLFVVVVVWKRKRFVFLVSFLRFKVKNAARSLSILTFYVVAA